MAKYRQFARAVRRANIARVCGVVEGKLSRMFQSLVLGQRDRRQGKRRYAVHTRYGCPPGPLVGALFSRSLRLMTTSSKSSFQLA